MRNEKSTDAPRSVASVTRRGLVGGSVAATLGGWPAQAQQHTFDAAAYVGKVLYLDFWASWCAPCQLSFPYMSHLLSTYNTTDFALVAVNVDHDRERADAFLSRVGGAVPVVFDARGAIAARYQIKAMPTSLLFGRDGRKRFEHDGFNEGQVATYDEHILELLHER